MNGGLIERTWLDWLVKVRIILITLLLVIELAITRLTTTNVDTRVFLGVIAGWGVASGILWVAAARWPASLYQLRAQVLADLVFATAVIWATGGIDTSFNFLFPLIIIVASILLSRAEAYLTAAFSFVTLGAILELSYFDLIPSYSSTRPDAKSLQAVVFINLVGYGLVAYFSNRLTTRLKQTSTELADQRGALENLQALHEKVVNAISGGLITTDLNGAVKLVNPAARRLLGRSEDGTMEGESVDALFDVALPRPRGGEPVTRVEVRARTPRGEERIFGVSVSALQVPVRLNGTQSQELQTVGLVYTFNDLTEIRRLEQELRLKDRLAAIGRLAAGIAHEIRNPLSSISGSVQVLSGIATLTDNQRALVQIVTRESERLNTIISDFLSYSRDRNFQMAPVELRSLLEDTLTLLQNQPGEVDLVREFAAEEAWVNGDADRLKQVFWNLSDNALKAMTATPKTGKRMALTVRLAAAGDEWQVGFRDTGPGINPQLNEKLFEPFQSGFTGGTGLGLAIVYQILQAHGARISVRSDQGRGTEFTLSFRKTARPEVMEARAQAV